MTGKILFEPHLPIKPIYFVGRGEEIGRFRRNIEAGLSSGRTASSAILGEWGLGKSSLLLKLLSILKSDYKDSVGIDLTVTEGLVNYYTFCQALLDRFHLQLSQNSEVLSKKTRTEIHKWRLSKIELFGLSAERNSKYYLTSGTSLLQHNLEEIWHSFLVPSKVKQIVFFLDDLHLLPEGGQKILLSLRGLFQSLAVGGYNYSLVFTANKDYFGRVRELAEPASRFFDKMYLSEFVYKDIEKLFTKDLDLAGLNIKIVSGVIKMIFEVTCGHPYFVSFIGKRLLELNTRRIISTKDFSKIWPKIFAIMAEEKFKEDISGINDRQLQFLKHVASINTDEVLLSQLDTYHRMYFSRTVKRGLLLKLLRGKYKLYHPLFKEYLKTIK